MSNIYISKNMPTMSGGTADRDSTFILGRRAFMNQTYKSANCNDSENLGKNIDYNKYKNKKTSNVIAKPINNNNSGLRTQRLRLTVIGSGSLKVEDSTDKTSFVRNDSDKNFVNNALSRVRGSGYVAPKKGK